MGNLGFNLEVKDRGTGKATPEKMLRMIFVDNYEVARKIWFTLDDETRRQFCINYFDMHESDSEEEDPFEDETMPMLVHNRLIGLTKRQRIRCVEYLIELSKNL